MVLRGTALASQAAPIFTAHEHHSPTDAVVSAPAAAPLGTVAITGLMYLVAQLPLNPDALTATVLAVVLTGLAPR